MNQYNVYPKVGFFEAIKMGFKKYVNFRDRSRRSEFWFFILFNGIISLILLILLILTLKKVEGRKETYAYIYYYTYYKVNPFVNVLNYIYSIVMFIPIISLQIRRLHDIGKSGVYLFFHLIPIVGSIILIVFYCIDSEPGQNLYGPSPKYHGNEGNPIFNQYPLAPNQSSNDVQLNVKPEQDNYLQPQENMINPQTSQWLHSNQMRLIFISLK